MIPITSEETVKLEGGYEISWKNIYHSIFTLYNIEQIQQIRLFGSCLDGKRIVTEKYEKKVGFWRPRRVIVSREVYKYPHDIDLLILLKTPVTQSKHDKYYLSVLGFYPKYEEACGYGMTFLKEGFIVNKLHLIVCSYGYFKKAEELREESIKDIFDRNKIIFENI